MRKSLPADHASGQTAEAGKGPLLLLLAVATLVSILYSGIVPFFNNNIYHLPILRADYDLPQFAGDAFVQSLRHFSSGFWLIFAGSASWIEPKLLLLSAFGLSRLLLMAAALHFARSFGYAGLRFSALFLLLIAVSPLARGYAPGGGGLNIDYFTHSEVANATLLLSLSLTVRGRMALSVWFACVTFFLNAFMAVWLAPLWLAIAVWRSLSEGDPVRNQIRGILIGMSCGLPLLIPVLWTIVEGSKVAGTPDYSYADYLRGFFPYHFFLDSLPWDDRFRLAVLSLVAVLVPFLLREKAGAFRAAGFAALVLLCIGSVMPLVTGSRFLLNLHFIRSAVLIQWLAVLGTAMVAAGWTCSAEPTARRVAGLLLAALMIIGAPALPMMVVILTLGIWGSRFLPPLMDRPLALTIGKAALASALAFSVSSALVPSVRNSGNLWAISTAWERIGSWVAANTAPESVLLLPVGTETPPPDASPLARNLAYDVTGFFATAGRSVWTNYKFGAAPMWAPQTYAVWRARYDAVRNLTSAADRIAYAAAHGISHVVTYCDPAVAPLLLHRAGDLCIYAARPPGGH